MLEFISKRVLFVRKHTNYFLLEICFNQNYVYLCQYFPNEIVFGK